MWSSNFLLLEFLLTLNAYYAPTFNLPVLAVDTMYNRVSSLIIDWSDPRLHGRNLHISTVK